MDISKSYNPKEIEDKIYGLWQDSGFFNPDKLPGKRKKTFTIVLPPPNVTGELHIGHALNAVVQDILIRWKRMQGYKTLWLPGTDHAGIATQVKVEKELRKEGKTRYDLGREKFIERVWQWKEKYGSIILGQFKKIGSSLDWSRTRFTFDKEYSEAVNAAFLHYYKKGLIYQGERPINWCFRCQTSLSDLEVVHEEGEGKLWYMKYPLSDGGYVTVATTRPETMLGDAAVAVNPSDKRYKKIVGKTVILPLVKRQIPVISDRLVDMNFGTGAVKVTPGHDLVDYEISLSHSLEIIKVIDEKGKIVSGIPNYGGLTAQEAREKILADMAKEGLLEKEDGMVHQLPYCERCKTKIEIIPSKQWFLKMKELASLARKEVKEKRIVFHPRRFEKTYFDWLSNVKDWCISRQLWWGHKIPVEGTDDVLDTWFSSALWPFATLGWPKKTKDLETFYPTQVLSTARDIVNLWVARMIFSGMEFMQKAPFCDVYIHPTVLNKEGKRMSKSLGTGVDPLSLVERYGADATRFGIIWQVRVGQDIRFSEENILMGKKFCNKIWNASRFVLMQLGSGKMELQKKIKLVKATAADKKIVKSLEKTVDEINGLFADFQFGKAAKVLYDFFWHDFCDQYIEISKKQIQNPKNKKQTLEIVSFCLVNSLILLHPFTPFITEAIYQGLPLKNKKKCLLVEDWPYPAAHSR